METIWKILGASGLISLVVFMQVLSCVFFRKHNDHDGNPLDEYNNTLLLTVLVPLFLAPVPMLLINGCTPGDAFSEEPPGLHWAQFLSAFFFTGCLAVPILLAVTGATAWQASLLNLGSILILCIACGLGVVYQKGWLGEGMLGDSLLR
mmetsp:Transcript_35738/g.90594  ORF Transcript_35738/g.90594 Transcript_35738/m.90594 type:complete len:149 (+) Transcript_35738:57-503(+)